MDLEKDKFFPETKNSAGRVLITAATKMRSKVRYGPVRALSYSQQHSFTKILETQCLYSQIPQRKKKKYCARFYFCNL